MVLGKPEQCGWTPVLPTYPAWTFGSRHPSSEEGTPGCYTTHSGFDGRGKGPRWGKGLAPKPLIEKQGPPAGHLLTPASTWPSVTVKPGRAPVRNVTKAYKVEDKAPGPGAYRVAREFESANHRKPYATMGLPHSPKRANLPPTPAPPPAAVQSVRVQAPVWKPQRREHKTHATPGPGQYHPCDSSFCACSNCEGIAQGKTFGLRPEIYTGNVRKAVNPSPAGYHVECTTLGAAAAPCDDAAAAVAAKVKA